MNLLLVGAILSFAVALLHVVCIPIGAPAYRYLGAGEDMASAAESGSPVPALLTAGLAVLFAGFGVYALSGAGRIAPAPGLSVVLVAVSAIYTLRGLALFLQLARLGSGPNYMPRDAVFSAVSLAIGIVHIGGLLQAWPLG